MKHLRSTVTVAMQSVLLLWAQHPLYIAILKSCDLTTHVFFVYKLLSYSILAKFSSLHLSLVAQRSGTYHTIFLLKNEMYLHYHLWNTSLCIGHIVLSKLHSLYPCHISLMVWFTYDHSWSPLVLPLLCLASLSMTNYIAIIKNTNTADYITSYDNINLSLCIGSFLIP